jgi:hypothetical protein
VGRRRPQAEARGHRHEVGKRVGDARSYELIARDFQGHPEGLTRDDILDNITIAG